MRIVLTSVFVDDQEKALRFYTDVLGFREKTNMPVGEARWLTVVSPEGSDDVELLLEPNGTDLARTYQQGTYERGIPATTFGVKDVRAEHARLTAAGVRFTTEPTEASWGTYAVFDDTCGNLINLHQM